MGWGFFGETKKIVDNESTQRVLKKESFTQLAGWKEIAFGTKTILKESQYCDTEKSKLRKNFFLLLSPFYFSTLRLSSLGSEQE